MLSTAKNLYRAVRLAGQLSMMRASFRLAESGNSEPHQSFCCNICGKTCKAPLSKISGRETPSCYHCGSTLRIRGIMAALSQELFGHVEPLSRWKTLMNIRGVGMSDSDNYAVPLAKKVSYQNTYYHKSPFLDITSLKGWLSDSLDFVITTDVFEHVQAPISIAFANLYRLLAKGGVCIFSVPYVMEGQTREHFPRLHEWNLERSPNGEMTLINKTLEGEIETFGDLCFHGGEGATLEMRLFSLNDIEREFLAAGFSTVMRYDRDYPEFGFLPSKCSHGTVFAARKSR